MFAKVICFAALLGVVAAHRAFSSQHLYKHDGHHQPVYHQGYGDHGHHDYFAHPKYEFGYKVYEPHTGDIKSQLEHRDGNVVKGFYALHQPHGSIRHVEYYGDKHSGFHADVKHSTHHIVPHNHY